MTHSKRYGLLFASGIGCIALGYALWMYLNMNKPDLQVLTLPPTLFAPFGAFTIAALCWYLVVEKRHRYGKLAGMVIGFISGWAIFASGLLIVFVIGFVIKEESIQNLDVILKLIGAVFGIGPLLLFLAWGWIPVLLCILWGAFLIPLAAIGKKAGSINSPTFNKLQSKR